MKKTEIFTAVCAVLSGFCGLFMSCHAIMDKTPVSLELTNGEVWKDTSGNSIQTHDNIIYYQGKYYWYGMDYSRNLLSGDRAGFKSVKCYESEDLVNWTFKQNVLTSSSSDLLYSADINTPNVVYNSDTRKFVMWMGYGTNKTEKYSLVATSSSPYGEFKVYNSYFNTGSVVTSLYKDDNDACYALAYSGADTLHIYRLTDDYLQIDEENSTTVPVTRQAGRIGIVKDELGGYYMLIADYGINDADHNGVDDALNYYYSFWTSGTAGYTGLRYAYSDSMTGSWTASDEITDEKGNALKDYEFSGVVRIDGRDTTGFLLSFNKWNSTDLSQSAYYWQPFTVDSYTHTVSVKTCAKLSIDAVTGTYSAE